MKKNFAIEYFDVVQSKENRKKKTKKGQNQ